MTSDLDVAVDEIAKVVKDVCPPGSHLDRWKQDGTVFLDVEWPTQQDGVRDSSVFRLRLERKTALDYMKCHEAVREVRSDRLREFVKTNLNELLGRTSPPEIFEVLVPDDINAPV